MRISELISGMSGSGDRDKIAQLEAMFPRVVFGLLMAGLPNAKSGQKLVLDGSGDVTMQFVGDPNGRKMIKACADPELFNVNYPGCVNVTMNGSELLEMAEKMPEADGILICSATSFHSYPIYKAACQGVKKPTNTPKKWWQLWRSF